MVIKLYKYFNILSLDVVAGACICSMFLADFLGVQLHWATVTLLGLSVWLIYTFDHLNDAKNITHHAATARHRFHQVYFKELTWVSMLVLAVASILMFKIPTETVVWGVALSCLVAAYFLLLFFLKLKSSYHKELTIAVLYSSGVLLGPLSVYRGAFDLRITSIFVQFFLLAFTNLLTFAVFEIRTDERDGSPSLVRIIGEQKALILLKLLVVLQILMVAALSLQTDFFTLEAILFVMITLLGGMIFLKRYFVRANLYRLIGDAAFMVPVFGLFFYG